VTGLAPTTALASQNFAVTGAAYDYAVAAVAPTLAFGNVRVAAGTTDRTLAVTNTLVAADAAFQDSLTVTATAGTHAALAPADILAGAAGNVTVTASTAVAGSLADTLALGFTSNANGLAGLTNLGLTGQNVAVTGGVYDLANPAYSTATLAFGNVRVGATLAAQNVAVTNEVITAAAYQDALTVAGSAANAKLTVTGFTGLAAGPAAGQLVVGASTAFGGSLAGDVAVDLTSVAAAAGLTDVRTTGATIAVTGAVYDYAQPSFTNATFILGNVRIGAPLSRELPVTNALRSPAAYQDSLDLTAVSSNPSVVLSLPGTIAPGASGNLSLNAASLTRAGSIDAVISFDFISRAVTGSGLADANLAGGTVNVFGAAYEYARPNVTSTLSLGNIRAGSSVTRNLAVTNVVASDPLFQDNLLVTATSSLTTLALTNPASIAAGASGNIVVAPSAAVAGSLNSTLTLALLSDARGLFGLADATLTAQTVAVTGAAYDLAQPTYATTALAFGNVRKGGALAARSVAFANTLLTTRP